MKAVEKKKYWGDGKFSHDFSRRGSCYYKIFCGWKRRKRVILLKKLIEALEKKQFQEQASINGSNFLKRGEFDCGDHERDGRHKIELMADIRRLLDYPYLSARTISTELGVDKDSVSRILGDEMGMKKVNFHWIAHELSDSKKMQRVDMARAMLHSLTTTRYFSTIITGD